MQQSIEKMRRARNKPSREVVVTFVGNLNSVDPETGERSVAAAIWEIEGERYLAEPRDRANSVRAAFIRGNLQLY